MRLTQLKLHNYRQHRDLTVDLDGHIVGVLGRNGSGKSNLLGSLQFAWSGEQTGVTKAGLLSWGAIEGHVELHFVHDRPGVIKRALHSNSAAMKYGDDTYNGITNVGEAIEKLFGMDKDLLKQTIFVRQAEIDSVLFTDPRVRELAFQRLCGIGDAAKVHKRLGEFISTMEVPQDFDTQIADGIQRKNEMQMRLRSLQDQQVETGALCKQLPDAKTIQTEVYALMNARTAADSLMKLQAVLSDTVAKHTRMQTELATIVLPPTKLEDVDAKLHELQGLINAAEAYERAYRAYEDTGKAIVALGDEPAASPMPFTDAQLTELRSKAEDFAAKYNVALSNLSMYRELAKVVTKVQTAECPVCGGPLKDADRLNKMIERFEAEVRSTDPGALRINCEQAYQQNQYVVRMNNQRATQYSAAYAERVRQFSHAEAAFKAAQKVTGSVQELRGAVLDLQTKRTQLVNAKLAHTRLTAELAGVQDAVTRLHADKAELVKSLHPYYPEPTAEDCPAYTAAFNLRITALNNTLQEIRVLNEKFAGLHGMLQELDNALRMLDGTIATLEKKRASQAVQKDVVGVLTAVRDWFHYLNGPHTITAGVLQEMTVDVNRFLEYFTAPFSVQPAQDVMGYKIFFSDGRQQPAEPPDATVLSGGERILLATAFRLASYCIFASRQGILSLDEPTVYLDDSRIGSFCTLLGKLQELAKQMKLQIFIATHEHSVVPYMDKIIDLTGE